MSDDMSGFVENITPWALGALALWFVFKNIHSFLLTREMLTRIPRIEKKLDALLQSSYLGQMCFGNDPYIGWEEIPVIGGNIYGQGQQLKGL